MIRSATFTAFLLLTGAAILSEAPEPSITLYHHDSGAANEGYHEVFRVTQATALAKSELVVTVDGEAIEHTWTGNDFVQAGDELRFHLVSFDAPRLLEIHAEQTVARLTFGGGAGTPIPP